MARSQEIRACLVCQGPDCTLRGSPPIGEELAARLAADGSAVEVQPYFCFGACPDGPNIVLYPEGTWYSLVTQNDAAEIAAHISGGPVVERLKGQVDYALQRLILELIDSGLGRFEPDD
jgi:(2Fe-2S) ferredoxin